MRERLDRIYRQHRQGLFSLALSITRDAAAAEDAVHDAFERLVRNGATLNGDATAYVFASVRNAAIDHKRRGGRIAKATSLLAPQRGESAPDASMLEHERGERVREAVEALPDDLREVVTLRAFAGLGFEQMAEALGEPLGTVNSRYRRALERLKEQLAGEAV